MQLEPCPFCGGVPRVVRTTDVDDMKWAHVECYGCGARTRGDWASSSSDQCPSFFQEVRAEWNRRACVSSATDALRAEVAAHFAKACKNGQKAIQAQDRAERLAEALREVRVIANQARVAYSGDHSSGTFRAIAAKIDAALEQENGR